LCAETELCSLRPSYEQLQTTNHWTSFRLPPRVCHKLHSEWYATSADEHRHARLQRVHGNGVRSVATPNPLNRETVPMFWGTRLCIKTGRPISTGTAVRRKKEIDRNRNKRRTRLHWMDNVNEEYMHRQPDRRISPLFALWQRQSQAWIQDHTGGASEHKSENKTLPMQCGNTEPLLWSTVQKWLTLSSSFIHTWGHP